LAQRTGFVGFERVPPFAQGPQFTHDGFIS
jgi:hypothetical protein